MAKVRRKAGAPNWGLGRSGELEQVTNLEPSNRACDRWLRSPRRVLAQVRALIELEQPQEDLGDDPATDRTKPLTIVLELGLLQDIEPQRRLPFPTRIVPEPDLLVREGFQTHLLRH